MEKNKIVDGTIPQIEHALFANDLCTEFVDDVYSLSSESTASLTDEYVGLDQNLPELTRTKEEEPSSSSSAHQGPPGTVKSRPKKNSTMSNQELVTRLQELCFVSDPHLIYSNMVKIGQGYVNSWKSAIQ